MSGNEAFMQVVAIVVSLVVTVVALPLIIKAVRDMLKVIRTGRPLVGRRDRPAQRTVNMLVETFGHTRMFQKRAVAVAHWFVYAAFIFLSTAVLQGYFQLFNPDFAWPIIGHWYPYEWAAEALGLLSTIGILYLILVRQRKHPRSLGRKSRFFGSTFWQAYFVEVMAMLEGAAILFIRGAEYKLIELHHGGEHGGRAHFPISSYVGDALYPDSEQGLKNVIFFVAMFKITLAMVWLMVIARNLTMGVAWHRFTAWPNIWFKRKADGSTALGGLQPIYINEKPLDLEAMEDLEEEDFEKLGVGKLEDFSWKGILDFTTCTECGRCQEQCPAWATDKPLSPKLLVMGLREHAYAKAPLLNLSEEEQAKLTDEQKQELERPLIGDESMYGVIDPDVLWSCTNCGACVQQCPVDIEHVDHIDDMRRFQVLVESNFPAELNNIFKGLERKGNPWGMSPKNRMDWAKDLDFEVKQVGVDVEDLDEVDWLFWVGCAGAYEDRAKKTTQAVAELLDMAGVTFAVLGDGETCTGDPARRAGNEIVFQQLAMQNAEVFKETKVKKVVSTCAHCFNTLKNEYAEFGVELEVVHHTQLLNRLVREGKLTPRPPVADEEKKKITYHDPCFVGRHNQVYEPPRELLSVIPGAEFTEMPRNKEKSFCCGAGGARMWMEETIGSRINVNRTEEAIATGADQIAVGCPFCRVMLSDGLTLKQSEGAAREEVEVLDVAQMLLAGVKRAPEPTKDDDAAVVAEAEAATASAATEAEPDAGDQADPDSISATEEVGAGAKAHTEGDPHDKEPEAGTEDAQDVAEELQQPTDKSDAADQEIAAESNVKLDERGGGHADESAAPTEPRNADARAGDTDTSDVESGAGASTEPANDVNDEPAAEVSTEPASEKEDAAWANVGAVNTDSTPEPQATPAEEVTDVPDETEPVEQDAREEEADTVATEEAVADVNDEPAGEKEDAAWANVGPVNTDLTPSEPAASPEETPSTGSGSEDGSGSKDSSGSEDGPAEKITHVPDEVEPVEEDAREEEAEAINKAKAAAPDEITPVEDGDNTADPVSEDVVELSDANPSGKDLSQTATQLSLDDLEDDEPKS
ncbi:heterodisulfide reductase-related iron-sulfur binding cluster [Aeromicrobium wangtongii]|uniref:Heterodisulfide reductase-related iron-sulfur binding cluster n=1 Tax=Aeromicrobium wangtongii TaxID=2969247 RepID=A0ABY5M5U3_9ACTN|nr:heterodisulfide reductase-related iron-sulfur binding cluster [Aeromicrobium wangtongii]MCD9199921.1 4Fe-4S dicluster domain-containing protein [Aeromicrobium wangtongii]UUP13538.1 heterodisulfide reductase-related iron-sulfur binding cluster [Aeromicrobium wangtongii]